VLGRGKGEKRGSALAAVCREINWSPSSRCGQRRRGAALPLSYSGREGKEKDLFYHRTKTLCSHLVCESGRLLIGSGGEKAAPSFSMT